MRNFKPVTRVTLCEQVAEQLAGMIAEEKWKPGEKLPSEAEMCRALNIGRSTLREALKSLAFAGMVRIRPGEGTYVAEPSQRGLERLLTGGVLKTERDLQDVWEARMVLETELAALAAERLTQEDERNLASIIEKMAALQSEEHAAEFSTLDVEFHLAIAVASKNKTLHQLLQPVRGIVHEWIMKSQELPGLLENAHEGHQKILEALKSRNRERARKAMEAHLQSFPRALALMGKVSSGQLVG